MIEGLRPKGNHCEVITFLHFYRAEIQERCEVKEPYKCERCALEERAAIAVRCALRDLARQYSCATRVDQGSYRACWKERFKDKISIEGRMSQNVPV